MSTVRVERNKAANLEQSFYVDGVLTNSSTPVTVTITRADGTVLVAGGATTSPSTGVYRYSLAPQANLDNLTVVWTGTWSATVQTETTYVELVGDFYVSLAEIRALPNLADTAKFTNAEIVAARQWFEETFEDYTGVAWVPRYRRVLLHGSGGPDLPLPDMHPRVLRSVSYFTAYDLSTPFTAAELAAVALEGRGSLRSWSTTFYAGANNYLVAYEHGLDGPPADVREAAKVAIRDKLLVENNASRLVSIQTEQGIIRSSLPSEDRPFGIPFVDAVAARRRVKGNVGSMVIG